MKFVKHKFNVKMEAFKDTVAKGCYNMTLAEAHEAGVCIDCKIKMVDLEPLKDIDIREWKISGVCPICWDKLAEEIDG